MTQSNKAILIALFLGALTYISCQTPETIEISPEYAIPLINSSMSIQNILDQTNTGDIVQVDGDNFITLNYKKEVLGLDTVSLIEIPGFIIPQLLNMQTVPTPFPADFDIDRITVKNGKLYIDFESNSPNTIEVNLTIPNITGFNETFTVSNPNGTVPLIYQDSFDIASEQIDFSNGTFTSNYTAKEVSTNTPILLTNFFLNIPSIDYSYIEGYFGQRGFVLPTQELSIELFEQWESGKVTFTDPKIKLEFKNSYGFPMRVTFDTLQAMTRDAGNYDLQINGGNSKDLLYPNNINDSKISDIRINKDNSNIISILEQVPYGIRYQFSGQTNPNANPNTQGFITDQSNLTITVIADLPMEGAIQNFTLVDTFALDLTGDNIPEGEAEFKVITNNGFPLDIDLQCYFLDEFGNAIDSMFIGSDVSIIQAAPIDGNGKVTEPFQTITFAGFTHDRINNIRQQVKNITLLGRFNSTNNGTEPIKLYADYALEVQIGVKIKPVIE